MLTDPLLVAFFLAALAAPPGARFNLELGVLAELAEQCLAEWPPAARA